MTKLLEKAVAAVEQMAPADQDTIAAAMLSMTRLGGEELPVPGELTQAELNDAFEGLAEVDRGEVASEARIEAAFRRFRP